MSNISNLWRRPYTLRCYSPQKYVNGYAVKTYRDITVMLDVQYLSQRELQLLPEGKRNELHLKTFGNFVIRTADVFTGTPADRLLFHGEWYECESSVVRDKTLLSHCMAQFVKVSEAVEAEITTYDPDCDEEK